MSHKTLSLDDRLYNYLLRISVHEPPVLKELREETAKHPMSQMQISPEQGQFMAFLIQLLGVKKALEIGVFTGYSALCTALSLPEEGQLIACDKSDEDAQIALKYWEKAGVTHKIDLRIAPALETLENLLNQGHRETFDFAFIDADKSNYLAYYEKCLQLIKTNGIIAIDNVLWSGKVADPEIQDNRTQKIRELNQFLSEDQRVQITLIPIGDGLTLARKLA